MNSILLLLAIALVGDTVLSANLKNDRGGRQFLIPPPGVFYPGYFNYPYFPYQPHPYQQLYKNQPFYESEGNNDARSPFRSNYDSGIEQDETEDHLEDEEREALSRQNLFFLSNINSAINPFQQFFNILPKPVISNPNNNGFFNNLRGTCKDSSGKSGICAPAALCSRNGGKASGACGIALVCCINTISRCGGQMTLNNTYWESPSSISSDSTCSLTITLDNNLIEQKKPVCQIRLDFEAFTTAQPLATGKCDTDKFIVGGAVNKVPTICGDNGGQHMYVEASSSRSSLQLLFSFGVSATARSWKIKVGLIPCGANFLAPKDCLQYFTASAGTVQSFNWKDTPIGGGVRQLSDQDYKICFRNELINDKKSVTSCLTQCATPQGGNSFLLTGTAGATSSANGGAACTTDFLLFQNAINPAAPATAAADRFCGGALNNAVAAAGPVKMCSNTKDFSIAYFTDANEPAAGPAPGPDVTNSGFCFTFEQTL